MGNYAGLVVRGKEGQSERIGTDVEILGDINNDGIADFAVTAPGADVSYDAPYFEGQYTRFDAGSVYVVFGVAESPDGFPTGIDVDDLDGTNGFVINADTDLGNRFREIQTDQNFGADIAALGDIDGDGIDDFGIIVPSTDTGFGYYGEYGNYDNAGNGVAFVILGGQDFAAVQEVDDLDGFRIDTEGEVTGIVGLGDINGDGIGDLAINTVDRDALGRDYVDFYYLYDYNGNGVYDAPYYGESGYSGYYERTYTGQLAIQLGQNTSYVIFGTRDERVSGEPIATEGGPGGPVALAAPSGDVIVNVNDLDGSDGFSVATGQTASVSGFRGYYFGYFSDSGAGVTTLGDINGDGINDLLAHPVDQGTDLQSYGGVYGPNVESNVRELRFVQQNFETGNGQLDVSLSITTNYDDGSSSTRVYDDIETGGFSSSFGSYVIFGKDSTESFAPSIDPRGFPTPDDVAYRSDAVFDKDNFAAVGNAWGNDIFDDFVTGGFLFNSGSENPFGVNLTGALLVGGSAQGGPDALVNGSFFDENALLADDDAVFFYDGSAGFISGDAVTLLGSSITKIEALGDVDGDGADDFALAAFRREIDPDLLTTGDASAVVYITLGSLGTPSGLVDLADSVGEGIAAADRAAYRIEGFASSFITSLAGGGDINNDGFADLIIGDANVNNGRFGDGEAYVVFGGLDALSSADAADGSEDGVIDIANLGVDVETGVLPIEISLRGFGFVSQSRSEGDSGATVFEFIVDRNGDQTQPVSFDFAVTPSGFDGAEAEDFVGGAFPTGTVDFVAGESTAVVRIEVQGDFAQENNEDFTVTISNPVTVGDAPISIDRDAATGRIFNDDIPVRLFVNNATIVEGNTAADNSALVFTVTRSGELDVDASVDYDVVLQTASADDLELGTPLSGTVSFAAGETFKQIVLPIAEDVNIENNETVRVNLSNGIASPPAGAPNGTEIPVFILDGTGIGTIISDDLPVRLFISDAFTNEGNPGDDTSLNFVVTRSGDTSPAVDVDVTFTASGFNGVSADDFETNPFGTRTVSFGAGVTSVAISLPIAEDLNIEASERIEARLDNARSPIGADIKVDILDSFGQGTIGNDDFPPRISMTGGGFVSEGSGAGVTPMSFAITREGDTTGVTNVTFDLNPIPFQGDFFAADSNDIAGIVIDGDEIVGSGFVPGFGYTVEFADGEAVKNIVVNINRDGIIEPRESFELRITNVETFNGTDYDIFVPARTGTILNDDGRPPVIPPGVEADVFGDPHIVSLDGLGYDFQAVGEYILVETLPGADNPFQVQVRFEPLPGSDLVSTTTRMVVNIGDSMLEVDALGPDPYLITNAAGETRTLTIEELAVGAADVDGDGVLDFYIDEVTGMFTVVLNDQNEQLVGKVMDGTMNVCVFLADTPTGNQGNVRGLMGDADGNRDTSDDLALRAGTVVPVGSDLVDSLGNPVPEGVALAADTPLQQPLDFDTLYGIFADGWRLDGTAADKTRAFSDTAPDFRDDFPAALLTVDDLPADVRAEAEAAVLATPGGADLDPSVFDAAVLDFALTGNPDFISGALGLAAEEETSTEPTNAPEIPVTVSVSVQPDSFSEGDAGTTSVTFTFFRLDDGSVPLSVQYELSGTADSDDFVEGTLFAGTIDFAEGETEKTVTVDVLGDLTTENDETLTATITDSGGALIAGASATATIATDDFAPEAQNDEFSTDADTRVQGDLLADNQVGEAADNSDVDADGDTLTVTHVNGVALNLFSAISLPSGARLRVFEDGTFIYDPFGVIDASDPNDGFAFLDDGEVATDSFTYTIADGNGGFDTATAEVTIQGVNDAPVARLDTVTLTEDDVLSDGNLLANDEDPDPNDTIAVTSVRYAGDTQPVPAGGSTTVTLSNGATLEVGADGSFSFVTNGGFEGLTGPGDPGNDSVLLTFSYTISDDNGNEDAQLLQVRVNGVNDAPVAFDDSAQGDEDTVISGQVSASDVDDDLDELTFALVDNATNGNVVMNPGGAFEYTPDPDFFGTDSFTYQVRDPDGAVSEVRTVSLTINDVPEPNTPPEASDDEIITTQGSSVTYNLIDGDGEVGLDTDDDGDPLNLEEASFEGTVLTVNGPAVSIAGVGDISVASSGALSFAPDAALRSLAAGDQAVFGGSYTISDGKGGTATANFTVTVQGTNDAPEADDDSASTAFETAVSIDVLANDTDVDVGDVVSVLSATDGANGTTEIVAGQIVYTPNAGFSGEDSFTYLASDGKGGSDTATVRVDVGEIPNRAPVAVDDSFSLDEDSTLSGNLITGVPFGGADSDPDGDALVVTQVNGIALATLDTDAGTPGAQFAAAGGGMITVFANGDFTFDTAGAYEDLGGTNPASGALFEERLTYTVADPDGLTSTADLSFDILGVNDAPTFDAAPYAFWVDENTTDVGNVTAQDLEGDDLVFALVAGGDADLFDIDPTTGAISFVTAPDFESGETEFDFFVSVSDGGETTTAAVSVEVRDVDEGPVLNDVVGTDGLDRLTGTDGADRIDLLGGRLDFATGLGGADVFDFTSSVTNGLRERKIITDFEVGVDRLDIGGAEIASTLSIGGRTFISLTGDDDQIVLLGVSDIGTDFLV